MCKREKEDKRIKWDLWREKKEEDKKIKKYLFILYFYYLKKLINNVMIKTKSKNQNYVLNIIFFFF